MATEDKCVKLAARALLEVVQSSGKNLELAVMRTKTVDGKVVPAAMESLTVERTEELVKEIEKERQEEQEKKKKKANK